MTPESLEEAGLVRPGFAVALLNVADMLDRKLTPEEYADLLHRWRSGDGDPTPPDDAKLAEVERLANGAIPGPWEAGDGWVYFAGEYASPTEALRNVVAHQPTAEYVAAMTPAFTLSLLAALASQRAARAQAEEERDRLRDALTKIAGDPSNHITAWWYENIARAALRASGQPEAVSE